MLNKELMTIEALTPPEGRIHFKTSKAMSGVNFFSKITDPNYDFSFLEVYVNDELTSIPANALTAAAGDDIRIVSLSKPYPFFRPYRFDCIEAIEEPLPFMDETDFGGYFYNCTTLLSIPENLFINNPQITNFYNCFANCISLTTIPEGLFDNNPNVTDFSNCFSYCSSLTSIPAGLFDNNTKVNDFSYCFIGCNSLTAIPQGLFDKNTNVTTFKYCFGSCFALTTIPLGLFDKNTNVTDFGYCFYFCRKLTVNIQIGSTTTDSVSVSAFAYRTAAKGTVYCRAGSNAYNAFLEDTTANVNVLTY